MFVSFLGDEDLLSVLCSSRWEKQKRVRTQTRCCSEEKERGVEFFRPSFPFLSFAFCSLLSSLLSSSLTSSQQKKEYSSAVFERCEKEGQPTSLSLERDL